MNLNEAYARYAENKDMNALIVEVRRFAINKASKRQGADAESLAQEATLRVWQIMPKFDPKRGNFRAWVATLTNNYLNTFHRSAKRQMQVEQETDEQPLEELPALYTDDRPPHRDASNLPPDMYKVAAMLELGYTRQEIANSLRCSIQTLERLVDNYKESLKAA